LVLAALVALDGWLSQRSASGRRMFRIEAAALWILICASAFVHGVGALSPSADDWNREPVNVDADPTRLWDWRDPQFLAPWIGRTPSPETPRNHDACEAVTTKPPDMGGQVAEPGQPRFSFFGA
jgi:hypothetical protein